MQRYLAPGFPKTIEGDPVFRIKQGSTKGPIEYVTRDQNGYLVSILGAVSLQFVYRKVNAKADTAIEREATIVRAEQGQVRYQWIPEDTENPGDFYAEWIVTFGTGEVQRFPIHGYQRFTIEPTLG